MLSAAEEFGKNVQLSVKYTDMEGNSYCYDPKIEVGNSVAPKRVHYEALHKIAKSLESIDKAIGKYLEEEP
jgi:hypothetical protein